jgi:hypothetical protein
MEPFTYPPASWPAPNYENPETRGNASIFIVTSVITAVVVTLRLYSRYYLLRSTGIDDVLLLAGYVCTVRFMLHRTNMSRYSQLDRHTPNIKP